MTLYFLAGLAAAAPPASGLLLIHSLLALAIIALVYSNATAINDLADLAIDQVNLPTSTDRPLLTGLISQRRAGFLAGATAALALALAVLLGPLTFWAVAAMLGFNWAYSCRPLRLSYRGLLALLLLPVPYAGFTVLLGWLVGQGSYQAVLAWLLFAVYWQFLARISLKDYRDLAGDQLHGKRTFLVRHGAAAVVRLATSAHLLAAVIGLWRLYPAAPSIALASAFFVAVGLVWLRRLGQAPAWPQQRLYISLYGRTATAQLVLLLAYLTRASWQHYPLSLGLIALLVSLAFMGSLYKIWVSQAISEHNAV